MRSRLLNSDPTHRRPLLFWLATVGLVCLFPLFFVGGPGWSDGPLIHSAWNLGHPIFFALLTLTIRPWRLASGWQLWALATIVVLLLGAGVELAQSLDNRDVDGRDIFRNLTGLWIVLALRPRVSFPHPYPPRDWLIRALAVVLLSIDLMVVTRIAAQQVQVRLWLPDLYNFQQEHPERFWRGNVIKSSDEACGTIAESALSIALTTRPYSGASLDNLPSDWRGYDSLTMILWNPQNYTIPVTLRINDLAHEHGNLKYHDRFNHSFQITPGVNRIHQSLGEIASAPKDRQMNMDNIRRLMLFTSDLEQPGRLCLGELRLSSGNDANNGLD
jgi:hypothetical protein